MEQLRTGGIKATHNVRAVDLPGALVIPVPSRTYDLLEGYTATWTVVLLAQGPGDLDDAAELEAMADVVAEVIPAVQTIEAASYVLPQYPDPKPAYLCRFENVITEENTP